jgi:hypothetical protein
MSSYRAVEVRNKTIFSLPGLGVGKGTPRRVNLSVISLPEFKLLKVILTIPARRADIKAASFPILFLYPKVLAYLLFKIDT